MAAPADNRTNFRGAIAQSRWAPGSDLGDSSPSAATEYELAEARSDLAKGVSGLNVTAGKLANARPDSDPLAESVAILDLLIEATENPEVAAEFGVALNEAFAKEAKAPENTEVAPTHTPTGGPSGPS